MIPLMSCVLRSGKPGMFPRPSCTIVVICAGVRRPVTPTSDGMSGGCPCRFGWWQAWQLLAGAESLLVLGSSLTVFSGYRFAERAHREGKAVLIINDGPTRADEFADLKLEGRLGTLLPELVRELRSRTVLRPHR